MGCLLSRREQQRRQLLEEIEQLKKSQQQCREEVEELRRESDELRELREQSPVQTVPSRISSCDDVPDAMYLLFRYTTSLRESGDRHAECSRTLGFES
ncbi:hypothetical protein FOZ62_009312 [Perkinsus olseni]|uniref:GED domain-containing protein n=1 Tax=Perkinsus olseni TaxID=32597 RepID=A0A7J6T118_PEROL|nr:hypothetical protein FOZ62_009312 [Perkinsus olseni]